MPAQTLRFVNARISPIEATHLLWAIHGSTFSEENVIDVQNPDFQPMLEGIAVDETRRIIFRGYRVEDGVRSDVSDEVALNFTLRSRPERLPPPDISGLRMFVDIIDDDAESVYAMEITR